MASVWVAFGVTLALGLSGVRAKGKDPGPYSRQHYQGPPYNSQIALYYKDNLERPKCYGTMVNFDVLVVPCSCVIKTPAKVATWYDHTIRDGVEADDPSNYKALVTTFEYHNDTVKNKLMAPVKKITLSPNCNTLFQYNVARVELGKTIERTKLAWVASPLEKRMRKLVQQTQFGTTVKGGCTAYNWRSYEKSFWNETVNGPLPKPQLREYEVSIVSWSACRFLVCPTTATLPTGAKSQVDEKVCANQVTESRLCVISDMVIPFCNVIPGTPVFCRIGALSGVVGFIHNDTQLCEPNMDTRMAVVEGINLALPSIQCDLRVIHTIPDDVAC